MNMSRTMKEDLIHVLNEIEDPELGIGIADMGLVYRAEWSAKGIDVEFTTACTSCPFSEALLHRINDILRHRFREVSSICVRLVFLPRWTPNRLSEGARKKLGWARTAPPSPARFEAQFRRDTWIN
jgi:metal-sulfur cluster biosynthetic enzyme